MATADSRTSASGWSLGRRLGAAFLVVGVAVTLLAFGVFSPRASSSFRTKSDVLVGRGADALRSAREEVVTQSRDVLAGLIDHTTDSRQRMFDDLPLGLYRGDTDALREAVKRRDEALGDRLRQNIEILSEEMDRRVRAQIAESLAQIQSEQRLLGQSFAVEVRRDFLVLAVSAFLVLFSALGFGLFRFVIDPLRDLRRSARAVAAGDLDVEVRAARTDLARDEVSALSQDFGRMVAQLRSARTELREKNEQLASFNASLSSEVERQTAHLETALDDLRGAQDQLIHAAKMSSVGTLAGGVAHEFGNLIAGIKGCAQDALETEEDPDRREVLDLIERTADRADQVTRGLLRFARRESSVLRPLSLRSVVEDAVRLVEPQARQVRVGLVFEPSAGVGLPGVSIRGDEGALQQVFVNLLTNAVQASASGSTVHCRVVERGPEVSVLVSDEGVGIEARNREHIFDPFFTTKDKETEAFRRGTGLGLSISYAVIQNHGGRIDVESEPGQGATFTVRLPAETADDTENRSDD